MKNCFARMQPYPPAVPVSNKHFTLLDTLPTASSSRGQGLFQSQSFAKVLVRVTKMRDNEQMSKYVCVW